MEFRRVLFRSLAAITATTHAAAPRASAPPPPTPWFPPPSSSSASTTSSRSCSSRDESPGGSDLRPAGGLPAGRDAENRHSRPPPALWRHCGSRRRRPRNTARPVGGGDRRLRQRRTGAAEV